MDTRTPRTPTGGRSPGFDDEPQLAMAKVPSDPAQVVVNHASFRVELAHPVPSRGPADAARLDTVPGARRRRTPVVWSGRTEPGGDPAAQLLQAVRHSGRTWATGSDADEGTLTQVLPRVSVDDPPTVVIAPRGPRDPGGRPPRLPAARTADTALDDASPDSSSAYDDRDDRYDSAGGAGRLGALGARFARVRTAGERPGEAGPLDEAGGDEFDDDFDDDFDEDEFDDAAGPGGGRRSRLRRNRAGSGAGGPGVRHAYYPGRRMNLGIVLLPMRVFLGLISIYAGMGKLADPVYFDGGERGSMVKWLRSLHPWPIAEPLRDFALGHPVGAGLTVAFLQVVVGVLTVMGLWQRVAAAFGALLSAALLVTVSWRTVPAYDAPDIIYLAAWSPLVIAGAPVYSMDARLAGEAWRRLGPRVELWQLRRRVLRRGAVMTAVVTGMTLLFGSMLGAAVRSSQTVDSPSRDDHPRNSLPGSPLPERSGRGEHRHLKKGATASASARERSARPSASASSSAPAALPGTPTAGSTAGSMPSRTQGATQGAQQRAPQRPSATAGPSSSGGTGGSAGTGGGASGGSSSGSSGGSGSDALGGLLG